jgi:hypothetical protein
LARGLERLNELREEMFAKLINELDAEEGDPDLEPSLTGAAPFEGEVDLELQCDDEGVLNNEDACATELFGEWEHDGREPVSEDEGAQCDDEGHKDDLEQTCGWPLPGGVGANSGARLDPATVWEEREDTVSHYSGAGGSEHVQAVKERLAAMPGGAGNVVAFPGKLTLIGPGPAYGQLG